MFTFPTVAAITLRPQLRAEVALAGVGQDGEHTFTVAEFRSDQAAGVKNRSRGDPAKNPLLLRKTARRAPRIVIRNRDEPIHHVFVEDLWNEARADTLNFVRTSPSARKHGRVRR